MKYSIRNFTKLTQVISTEYPNKVVTEYLTNRYTQKFSLENHLIFLLFYQLTGKESLKEMVDLIKINKKVREYVPKNTGTGYSAPII